VGETMWCTQREICILHQFAVGAKRRKNHLLLPIMNATIDSAAIFTRTTVGAPNFRNSGDFGFHFHQKKYNAMIR
jgi:hypothetical protein